MYAFFLVWCFFVITRVQVLSKCFVGLSIILICFISLLISLLKVECDLEEYDFDDYNSVASTASLLNIPAELRQETVITRNHSYLPTNQNAAFLASPPNGTVKEDAVIYGSENSPFHLREKLMRMSKMQASISKVNNWSKFGLSGAPSKDEWRDVFLDAAQDGDLKKMVIKLLFKKEFNMLF